MRQTGMSPGLLLQFLCCAISEDSTNFLRCSSKEQCIITGLSKSKMCPGYCFMWDQMELVETLFLMSLEWSVILLGRLRPVSPK